MLTQEGKRKKNQNRGNKHKTQSVWGDTKDDVIQAGVKFVAKWRHTVRVNVRKVNGGYVNASLSHI